MYVTTEQKQADRWLARVRLETETGWRCFQAAGDSRVGALMELHHAMWRYQGQAYEAARRAVVTAASQSPLSARALRERPMARRRRVPTAKVLRRRGHARRPHRQRAWA
jgi:hypothetical protein